MNLTAAKGKICTMIIFSQVGKWILIYEKREKFILHLYYVVSQKCSFSKDTHVRNRR